MALILSSSSDPSTVASICFAEIHDLSRLIKVFRFIPIMGVGWHNKMDREGVGYSRLTEGGAQIKNETTAEHLHINCQYTVFWPTRT